MQDPNVLLDRHVYLPSVPLRYRHCRLSNFQPRTSRQREALAAIQALDRIDDDDASPWPWDDGDGAIILTGPCGVGKTHLAVAKLYADAVWEEGKVEDNCVFVACADAAPTWADRRHRDIDALIEPAYLVLDDLLPPTCAAEAETLALLIDRRYRAKERGLILTTNMTPAELRHALGDRTADRLRDGALILALDGASQRKPRQAVEASKSSGSGNPSQREK